MDFLEPKASADDLVGDRDRLLGIGMTAVFLGGVVFGSLRLFDEIRTGLSSPWWGNAGGAVCVGLLRLWVRRSPNERSSIAVHGTALVATVALIIPAAYQMPSSKWWLALVAFSVLLMGRRREAIVWAAITTVLLPLTAVLEGHIAVPHAIGESPAERAFSAFFFMVAILATTLAFRNVAQQRAKALTETAASLERSNRVRSQFLAHMSHELRTPLHGVIAMTDLARGGEASTEVHEQVETAQQSARVLLELLNNILDVTRADADAVELHDGPFSLHGTLIDVLRPFEAQARAKGIVLEARTRGPVVEARIGDRVRVSQVALNLLSNALKFTDQGTIVLEVSESSEDPADIELTVADTGRGIAEENLSSLFEPFAQVGGDAQGGERGAGLGLTIVRELARRMHGSASVTSRLGEGSTFRVALHLPCDGSEVGPLRLVTEKPADTQREHRTLPPRQRSLAILVCEDDPVSQRVASLMLKKLGHAVTVCDDGQGGWNELAEHDFDLLLTDIEMPEIDGVELTRKVRDREAKEGRPRLPIIAATAHVGEDERHRLIGAGVDIHVPKPFTIDNLSRALDTVSKSL